MIKKINEILQMRREKTFLNCINKVKNKFVNNHYLFLSEDDIRGYLYAQLIKKFGNLEESIDNQYTIPLHSNVSFKGEDGRLRKKPDLVIIDVKTMHCYSLSKEGKKLSKGFEFPDAHFVVELKLCRKGGKKFAKKILTKDIEKCLDLKSRNQKAKFYVLFFDKKRYFDKDEINEIKLKYKSINLDYITPR